VKKLLAVALGAFLISGCANNVGLNPETNVSKFDGVKTVTIQPHGADCCMSIGAFWTEKSLIWQF
jgi:PBP1b-binding outer membrane lipoprotein LpoB